MVLEILAGYLIGAVILACAVSRIWQVGQRGWNILLSLVVIFWFIFFIWWLIRPITIRIGKRTFTA